MRPLTILVDMDDTIECMLKTWVKWLNRKYDRNVDPKDVTNWDMRVAFPGLTYDDMGTVIGEREFWEEVEPMKDA